MDLGDILLKHRIMKLRNLIEIGRKYESQIAQSAQLITLKCELDFAQDLTNRAEKNQFWIEQLDKTTNSLTDAIKASV